MARLRDVGISLLLFLVMGVQAVTVFDGIRAANASLFASWIERIPDLAALYNSSSVKTVYAPTDTAFQSAVNGSGGLAGLRRLMARQAVVTREGSVQCSNTLEHLTDIAKPLGSVINTNVQAAGATRNQVVVAHPSQPSNGSASKRDLTNRPVRIFSGLGNNVSIVKADTPYDGGVVHTVDGFFTLPVSFNQTFNSTNATTFSSGLAAAGLGSILDNPAGVTIFSTNNEAYQAGVGNASTSALTRILSNQIIPNFLGYTPLLPNGTVLTTQGGTKLTVTVKNGVWFVNGAKIIAADQITSNGVAHIVDSIITPTTPLFTGAASSPGVGALAIAIAALSLLLALIVYD